ncbi:hypothetical protein ACFQ88_28395 [Paenibacillus sp. NPDC056579]|uniref:hypothetical protein n=1 Tax=Paenibacillus sp. NPDC056579 TaxID=3345871 RepID=UPI0036759BC3
MRLELVNRVEQVKSMESAGSVELVEPRESVKHLELVEPRASVERQVEPMTRLLHPLKGCHTKA